MPTCCNIDSGCECPCCKNRGARYETKVIRADETPVKQCACKAQAQSKDGENSSEDEVERG